MKRSSTDNSRANPEKFEDERLRPKAVGLNHKECEVE